MYNPRSLAVTPRKRRDRGPRIRKAEQKQLREYVLQLYDEGARKNMETLTRLKQKHRKITDNLNRIGKLRGREAYHWACLLYTSPSPRD